VRRLWSPWPRRCAACGGLCLLLRCLRSRWGWPPQGPRPGGWARNWSEFPARGWDLGVTQGSAFVRGGSKFSALVTGSCRERSTLGSPAHERRILASPQRNAVLAGQGFFLLVDRATRREHPCPPGPGRGGSSTAYGLRRWQVHRRNARTQHPAPITHEGRILRPPADPPMARDPGPAPAQPLGRGPFGDHSQRDRRQRSSEHRPPQAAHRQGHDERSQRTSRSRPSQTAHQRGQDDGRSRAGPHAPTPRTSGSGASWVRCVSGRGAGGARGRG
jgi:hypothetical protein